jgi:hypothetical protein
MRRRVDHALHDILQAIDRIEEVTFTDELPRLKRAVEALQKLAGA